MRPTIADKENAVPPAGAQGAAGPRLARAAAKFSGAAVAAAAVAAAAKVAGATKRRRVALRELPALAYSAALCSSSHPINPRFSCSAYSASRAATNTDYSTSSLPAPVLADPNIYSHLCYLEVKLRRRSRSNYIKVV